MSCEIDKERKETRRNFYRERGNQGGASKEEYFYGSTFNQGGASSRDRLG